MVGMFDADWWLKSAPCATDVLIDALDGAIVMEMLPISSNDDRTISDIVSAVGDAGREASGLHQPMTI